MKTYMSGTLGAFEALMRETPNMDHRDDGCDGRFPECRHCRYHLPYSKRQDCLFPECPYMPGSLQVPGKGGRHGSIQG